MIFFKQNLRYLRVLKGLTQEELAIKIGVKANTVSNYETGSSSPDFEMLDKIVKVLGVSSDTILFEDISEPNLNLMNEDSQRYQLADRKHLAAPSNSDKLSPFDFMQTVLLKLDQMQKEIKDIKEQLPTSKNK